MSQILRRERLAWWAGLVALFGLGLVLRLHGVADPILDHPGWRQGDTAAIARNFALLRFNIMYPQTMYNGPPPNYVELELQIVPYLAATLYKLVGIHEIIGRLLSIAFSLGAIITLAYFARWLFSSAVAGLFAAFVFATLPGSVYYGRTFMPDAAMVFFFTAALFAAARFLTTQGRPRIGHLLGVTALVSLAYLAKPVAVVALVPIVALLFERRIMRYPLPWLHAATLLIVPLLILGIYDRRVASYAQWHWASGITRLHVVPALVQGLTNGSAFMAKLSAFGGAFTMLHATMLGGLYSWLALAAFIALPWLRARSKGLLWAWLVGGLAYAYVVVTVERVDYYLLVLLPPCALVIAGAADALGQAVHRSVAAPAARFALIGALMLVALVALVQSHAAVADYYHYNAAVYGNARALDRALPAGAIVVIGHYGPDLQY
ncbi:MAG: glycosyltransferase family 39 protein, partial [Candidatus Eremiobacteraeota bacterium]|nr:glycosyltransferase family 39 protein [Candidatus Eremiobacteraeota bacterium]